MAQVQMHPDIKAALSRHVDRALQRMAHLKYRQEPNFMVTLIGKLDGVVYEGLHGRLELIGIPVDDRGPGAAESVTGADFALTAVIKDANSETKKAVLGQAKGGDIESLNAKERKRLAKQIQRMRHRTKHYVIVETPTDRTETVLVRRSKVSDSKLRHPGQTLADYLELMIACRHGDTRKGFTAAVMSDSSLPQLRAVYDSSDSDRL